MMDRRWKVSLRRREIDNERERERDRYIVERKRRAKIHILLSSRKFKVSHD